VSGGMSGLLMPTCVVLCESGVALNCCWVVVSLGGLYKQQVAVVHCCAGPYLQGQVMSAASFCRMLGKSGRHRQQPGDPPVVSDPFAQCIPKEASHTARLLHDCTFFVVRCCNMQRPVCYLLPWTTL